MLKQLTLAMGLVAAMATTGSAASVYGTDVTGADLSSSRSGASQITGAGSGNFYTGLSVTWNIQYSGGLWHYDYTFAANSQKPDFSHVILELSNGLSNLNVTTGPSPEYGTYVPNPGNNSNPNLPADIYGAKFNGNSTSMHLVFTTDRAPVWGNFYATGANGGPNSSQAWNVGMGIADFDSSDKNVFIARPDTHGAVPEPSSIALLGCSAVGLAGYGLRRRKASRA